MYGGVNFEPYRAKLFESIGRPVDSIELFPASEGFLAFQDEPGNPGLLLLLDAASSSNSFPPSGSSSPTRPASPSPMWSWTSNYALVLTSNAGLWAYQLGDTVRFVSLTPHRVVVTGRIKHFLSAFGEHVIGEEVEQALRAALAHPEVEVTEFTVAPLVSDDPASPRATSGWSSSRARRTTPPPSPPPSMPPCATATTTTTTCAGATSWCRCSSRRCRPGPSSAT